MISTPQMSNPITREFSRKGKYFQDAIISVTSIEVRRYLSLAVILNKLLRLFFGTVLMYNLIFPIICCISNLHQFGSGHFHVHNRDVDLIVSSIIAGFLFPSPLT